MHAIGLEWMILPAPWQAVLHKATGHQTNPSRIWPNVECFDKELTKPNWRVLKFQVHCCKRTGSAPVTRTKWA
eukprot:2861697-Amphidinium_carterae.1